MKEVFRDKDGKLSAKRIIGTVIIAVSLILVIDAHFSDRDLNDPAFNSMLYTGGVMIVGGVLEGRIGANTGNRRSARRSSLNEREGHVDEREED